MRCEGLLNLGWTKQCSRSASVLYNGKWYCGTHDPQSRQARKDASYAKRGLPKGYRRLYGVNVPERGYEEIAHFAHYVHKKTNHDIEIVRTLIRVLVRTRPLLLREERNRLRLALFALAARDRYNDGMASK